LALKDTIIKRNKLKHHTCLADIRNQLKLKCKLKLKKVLTTSNL